MFQHGLLGILRTGRIEAAARTEQGRDEPLVEFDAQRDDPGRRIHALVTRPREALISRASIAYGNAAACARAIMTIRTGGCGAGKASRAPLTRRFTRFRTTAVPTDFATETATRDGPERELATCVATVSLPLRRPVRRTNAISPERRSGANQRNLNGQALAALFAAGSENFASVLRAHALEKAMHALAAPVMGLEGTFHDGQGSRRTA